MYIYIYIYIDIYSDFVIINNPPPSCRAAEKHLQHNVQTLQNHVQSANTARAQRSNNSIVTMSQDHVQSVARRPS